MWGISWGGFNAIQVALRRPPALKAILAVDASDDLFHDDVHYIDGLPHLDEYALMIDHLNMLPPAPDFPLDEAALARMDTEPWLISFLAQAQDGPFWRRASLRPDYGRLTVPGLPDRRLVRRLPGLGAADAGARARPGQGADRPLEPHLPAQRGARPGHRVARGRGPLVGSLAQGQPRTGSCPSRRSPCTCGTGIRRTSELAEIPGRWRQENALPPERAEFRTWFCGPDGSLSAEAPAASARWLRYVPSAGIAAGHWWGELTGDQRDADAWSLTFDSAPLDGGPRDPGFSPGRAVRARGRRAAALVRAAE